VATAAPADDADFFVSRSADVGSNAPAAAAGAADVGKGDIIPTTSTQEGDDDDDDDD